MLKVFMILFLAVYVLVVLYNNFVKPFQDGYRGDAASGQKKRGNVIVTFNPEKGKKSRKGNSDDYIDYEEIKD